MKYTDLQKEIIKVLIGEQGLPNMPKGMRDPGEDDAPKKPKALEPGSEPKAEKPVPKAEPAKGVPDPKAEPAKDEKPKVDMSKPKVDTPSTPNDTTYSDNIDTKVDVPKERGLLSKNAFPREPGEVRFKAPENIKPSPKVMDIPNNSIPTFNTKHYKRYI
jgi:hypothetical protein